MDTGIEKFVPSFGASAAKWIQFHKELRKIFTKREANMYWLKAWNNTGGDSQSTANTSALRDYMSGQGVQITASNFFDSAGDAIDDLTKVANMWITVAIVIILAAIALGIYFKINPPKQK